MLIKRFIVFDLDIFIYDLKKELDSKNIDYVMIIEDGYCEIHIGDLIYFLYNMNEIKVDIINSNIDLDKIIEYNPYCDMDNIIGYNPYCDMDNINIRKKNKKFNISKKKQMKYENNKYKLKMKKQIKSMFK